MLGSNSEFCSLPRCVHAGFVPALLTAMLWKVLNSKGNASIGEERDALAAAAKEHLECLEADKKLCWRARALGTVQRAFLCVFPNHCGLACCVIAYLKHLCEHDNEWQLQLESLKGKWAFGRWAATVMYLCNSHKYSC